MMGTLVLLLTSIASQAANDQCLIVRSAEGHRFRNSMIAGALTGGIGFAAGAAFSGAKYEYAASFNIPSTKPKYKGKELEELQRTGVHVIVVNKKTASAEMDSARNSCKGAAPAVAATASVAPAAPAPTQAPSNSPASASNTQVMSTSEPSLGDVARQAKAQKEQSQPPQ